MKRLLVFLGALLLLAAGCSDYDTEHPDTKSNRKLFSNLTGVKADAGIREVYAYADELGFDAHYCLAFKATPEAVERIVKKMKLMKKDRIKDKWEWDTDFFLSPRARGGTGKREHKRTFIEERWS